jgi:hypothetical protein
MIFKTDIHPWIQYLIVILLVCFSGNQPFTGGGWGDERANQLLIAFFLFLGVLYFTHRKSPLALSDLSVIFLFLMILAAQALSFNFFPLVTIAGFIMKLFIGFAAVRLVNNFPHIYINVMYIICIVSLCFYVPEQLFHMGGHDFASFFTPVVHLVREVFLYCCDAHILFYNFEDPSEWHTNAGIFWESGSFAGYILLALIFLGLNKDNYSKRFYMIRFLVMMITLFTTLSTMGSVVCSVILPLHYRSARQTVVKNLGWLSIGIMLTFPLLVYGAIKVWSLDYMGPKIIREYKIATSRSYGWEITRFGNLLFDLEYIKRRPILGWGLNPKTRYALDQSHYQMSKGQGNGLTGFVHGFGLLGFGIFVISTWKGLNMLSGSSFFRGSIGMLAILLMLNGEQFLAFPLFLGLMFLQKSERKSITGDKLDFSHFSPHPRPLPPGEMGVNCLF